MALTPTHRSQTAFSHRSSGFTLIELSVVVAIIATLAAFLIPVISTIRRQARTVVCMVSLNQVGAAIVAYANDNRGRLPLARFFGTLHRIPPSNEWLWTELIGPYAEIGDSKEDADHKMKNVFKGCTEFKMTVTHRMGYGYNKMPLLPDLVKSASNADVAITLLDANRTAAGVSLDPGGEKGVNARNSVALSAVTYKSSRIMVGCSDEYTLGVSHKTAVWSGPDAYGCNYAPHRRRCNWLYYDLHSDTRSQEEALTRIWHPEQVQ